MVCQKSSMAIIDCISQGIYWCSLITWKKDCKVLETDKPKMNVGFLALKHGPCKNINHQTVTIKYTDSIFGTLEVPLMVCFATDADIWYLRRLPSRRRPLLSTITLNKYRWMMLCKFESPKWSDWFFYLTICRLTCLTDLLSLSHKFMQKAKCSSSAGCLFEITWKALQFLKLIIILRRMGWLRFGGYTNSTPLSLLYSSTIAELSV